MKKRTKKKLMIVKETLVSLKNDQLLAPYGGGDTFYACSFFCPTSGGGFCNQDCDSGAGTL